MKKLNNKGIGHHLLIVMVVVLAFVIGAGYFVWNKQSGNGINARADSYQYTDLSTVQPIGASGSKDSPQVAWYACKMNSKTSAVSIYTMAKYAVGSGPRVKVGAGAVKKVMVSKNMNNSALMLPRFQLKNVSEFMVQSEFTSGQSRGSVSRTVYSIGSLGDCIGTPAQSTPNKYTDLSTIQPTGASGSIDSATVAWYACKTTLSNTSFTINVLAKHAAADGSSVKVGAGYGKTVLVSETMTNTAVTLPGFNLDNTNEFMVQSEFTSSQSTSVNRLSYKISDIGNCR